MCALFPQLISVSDGFAPLFCHERHLISSHVEFLYSSTKVGASLWFSEENYDPTEIIVDALDRKRSSPGMRNKRLSRCLPRTRANFVSHNITAAAKKAVAYTNRYLVLTTKLKT